MCPAIALITGPQDPSQLDAVVNSVIAALNASPGFNSLSRQYNILASTVTLTSANDGQSVLLNRADGITVTLPTSTGSGVVFKFITGTTVTSNSNIIQANNTAGDTFQGNIIANNIGTGVVAWPGNADVDKMTFNGGTTGGIIGDVVTIQDTAPGVWTVTGVITQTSTGATPFGDT